LNSGSHAGKLVDECPAFDHAFSRPTQHSFSPVRALRFSADG
jgi:hypothetical protein